MYVEGRLRSRQYERRDGTPGFSLDVNVTEVQSWAGATNNRMVATAAVMATSVADMPLPRPVDTTNLAAEAMTVAVMAATVPADLRIRAPM